MPSCRFALRAVLSLRGASRPHTQSSSTLALTLSDSFLDHPPCLSCNSMPSFAFVGRPTHKYPIATDPNLHQLTLTLSFLNAYLDICLLPCPSCHFVSSYASVGHPIHTPNHPQPSTLNPNLSKPSPYRFLMLSPSVPLPVVPLCAVLYLCGAPYLHT